MAPYGDRSKVVIEPMLTDQWFVDTAKIVGPALDAVRDGTTEILPEQHKKVYFNWLENIEPWCISRQLWWGHQIPVWYGPGMRFDDDGNQRSKNSPTSVQHLKKNFLRRKGSRLLSLWLPHICLEKELKSETSVPRGC